MARVFPGFEVCSVAVHLLGDGPDDLEVTVSACTVRYACVLAAASAWRALG